MIGKSISSNGYMGVMCFVFFLMLRPSFTYADLCQADINNDGKVDNSDLMMLRSEMGKDNCFEEPCKADLNGDGAVNDVDGEILKKEFNRKDCTPSDEAALGEQNNLPSIEQEAEFFVEQEEPVSFDTGDDEETEEDIELPKTRFQDNEDGTVTDPETALMWTKDANPAGDTMLFHYALDYIEKMNEGEYPNFAYTDWRLPTLDELRSLIDYTKLRKEDYSLLPVHTLPLGHPFDNVKPMSLGWGGNTYLYTTEHSWFTSLYCRLVGHNVQSCYGYVWPVRGGKQKLQGSHLN